MQAQAAQTPAPAPGPSSATATTTGNGRRTSGASYSNILAANLLNRASGNISPASSRTAGFGSKAPSAIGTQDVADVGNANLMTTLAGKMISSQTSKGGGPRLRAEGIMAPPASDAATLRRQVAALQMDLETHVENEKRLQTLNQQLRERLELYMQQNHENVERAESELNTLHEDMEQTLDLQRRLAQRATSLEKEKRELEQALEKSLVDFEAERLALQQRITRLNEELQEKSQSQSRSRAIQAELEHAIAAKKKLEDELNSSSIETDFLKHKADEYSNELQKLLLKRQKEAVIEESFRRNLLRRSFHNFRKAVEERRLLGTHDHVAIEFSNGNIAKRGIHALHLAARRAIKIREASERQAKAGLEECWRGWRLVTIAEKKYAKAVERRKQSSLCSAVSNWRSLMKMGKLSKEEEQQLTKVATRQWRRFILKQYLKRWNWWLKAFARPKKAKLRLIQAHFDQLIVRQALYAWKSSLRARQISILKKEQAYHHGSLACKRRTLARWLEYMSLKQDHQALVDKALAFYAAHQRKFVVTCWASFVEKQRQKRQADQFAFKKYLHALMSKALAIWKHNVNLQQAEHRAIQEVNQALKRASLLVWRDYLVLTAVKQKKEMKAFVNKKRKENKTVRAFLIVWWEEMAWRRRAGQVTQLLSMRRHRTLLVNTLHGWMHATFDNLLMANARYQTELCEAKALCDEHKHQTTVVDVENLQLIDRLHAMSSEIALLKITISEKEKQEDELRRALEDGAVIEGSLQGDLDQQTMRMHELEMDIVSLKKKLQTKNLEDTAGEVHRTLEIQNLERNLKNLQIQLAEKTSQLDSYEKALKDTAEKLEGASDESQEKLTSAFEIAASLRRLLEDRENQCATLEGTCRRKEVELGEVQKKLSVATSKFSETLEARDARIHELENILMRKQAEMQESQQEYQELQRTLDNKEASVRRLEYEMKLKHDRESNRAKSFVSGLTSWTETGSPKRESPHILDSMRTVYNQARAALQEGAGEQHYVLWGRDDEQKKDSESDQPEVREMSASRWTVHEEQQQQQGSSGENTERTSSSSDEEEGVAAEEKPGASRAPYVTETGSATANSSFQETTSEYEGDQKKSGDKVETLHEEIQQLQARIMSRLRDSSPSHM